MLSQRGKTWYVDTVVAGKRTRVSLKTTDKAIAMQKMGAVLFAPPAPASSLPTAGHCLREAFKRVLRLRPKWRDSKDGDGLESTLEALVEQFGEDKPVNHISEDEVLDWIDVLLEDGQAPTTINRKLSMLSVLCKELKYTVPPMPRMTVREGRIRTLTDTEVLAMINTLPARMEPLVLFQLHMATRLSEALNCLWRDVNLESRRVAIWQNKASHPRVLPMSDLVVRVLTSLKDNGLAGPFANLNVFDCDHEWADARKRVGLSDDPQFVIHALRHTSITRLAEAGENPAWIQKFAGHKNIATTMRYVHLNPESIRDLACVQDRVSALPFRGAMREDTLVGAVVAGTFNPLVASSNLARPTSPTAGLPLSEHQPETPPVVTL